jgi:ferredoxin
MAVTVHVDRGRCLGLGLCVGMAPEQFKIDGDGRSVPLEPVLTDPDRIDLARDVAECCPMEAVALSTRERDTPAVQERDHDVPAQHE